MRHFLTILISPWALFTEQLALGLASMVLMAHG